MSAIARRPDAYEHIDPDAVGNGTRFVVSELAGRSTLEMKAREIGLEIGGAELNAVVSQLKELEHEGYHFEAADGSLELLMRRADGLGAACFELESFRVITDDAIPRRGGRPSPPRPPSRWTSTASASSPPPRATARSTRSTGAAARWAPLPALDQLHLTDFKVRVLDTSKATGAVTRVLIDSTNGERSWSTIGVSENIIEASWRPSSARSSSASSSSLPDEPAAVALHHADRPVRLARASTTTRARSRTWRPGVHLPAAARRGAPTGPATSAPASPTGTLLGRPGPNVGYAVTLAGRRAATGSRSAPHEHTDDALAVDRRARR